MAQRVDFAVLAAKVNCAAPPPCREHGGCRRSHRFDGRHAADQVFIQPALFFEEGRNRRILTHEVPPDRQKWASLPSKQPEN